MGGIDSKSFFLFSRLKLRRSVACVLFLAVSLVLLTLIRLAEEVVVVAQLSDQPTNPSDGTRATMFLAVLVPTSNYLTRLTQDFT